MTAKIDSQIRKSSANLCTAKENELPLFYRGENLFPGGNGAEWMSVEYAGGTDWPSRSSLIMPGTIKDLKPSDL